MSQEELDLKLQLHYVIIRNINKTQGESAAHLSSRTNEESMKQQTTNHGRIRYFSISF